MTIADVVAAEESAKGTAFKEGRDAGLKGYSPKDQPYDDPASHEAQAWLDGLGDGAKRRTEIERGEATDDDAEQQKAA